MEENPLDTYTKMCEEANDKLNSSEFIKTLEKANKITNEHLAERKKTENVFSHIFYSNDEYKRDLECKKIEECKKLLEDILYSLGANLQKVEIQGNAHNELLTKLIVLLEESNNTKDTSKVKEFFEKVPADVAVALIAEALKKIIGL